MASVGNVVPKYSTNHIGNNLIDTKGSVFLSHLRALKLHILDVSGNEIKDEGFTVLLSGRWKALLYLKLSNLIIIKDGLE